MFNPNFIYALSTNPSDSIVTIITIALIGVVFYFFMIRPQKKQDKEISDMRSNLEVGDEVTTIGGIVGEIVSIREETVIIETGKDHVRIRFLRSAIRCVDVPASSKNGYRINTSDDTAAAAEESSFETPDEAESTKNKKDKKKNKK